MRLFATQPLSLNPLISILSVVFFLAVSTKPTQGQEQTFYLFEQIFQIEGKPKITLETDYKHLLRKRRDEEYQPASFDLKDSNNKVIYHMDGRMRSRGNKRKEVCAIPPIKFDFSDETLIAAGLDTIDKIKFVLPCKNSSLDQERLYKEKFLYDLYHLIDTNSMQSKLVDIEFIHEGKSAAEYVGYVVEDEEAYASRHDAQIVESGRLSAAALDRPSFLKIIFFQFMLGNTDWAVETKHNLELVKFPWAQRIIAIPYDFDYSGFVDQSYAVPHESMPIKSVRERYFHVYKMNQSEFDEMVEFYKSKESEIMQLLQNATYMQPKTIDQSRKYLEGFFKLLKKPNSNMRRVIR